MAPELAQERQKARAEVQFSRLIAFTTYLMPLQARSRTLARHWLPADEDVQGDPLHRSDGL
jgi:hypothetical protein